MTDQHMQKMPAVELGRTGLRASRFGLGGFHQLEVTSDIVEEVVNEYLWRGGNYIETARAYGKGASEEKIGRALAGRRDEVILCSKTPAADADGVKRDLEKTLKSLRTDHLDIYFFHNIMPEKLDRITAPGGALEAFLQAREQGLIRQFGMSSHWPPVYLDAMDRLPLDVILIWCNYLDNLNFPIIPARIIPDARRKGIAVTAMKPLADGLLWQSVDDAVRYCLGCDVDLAVSGTNSPQQVRELAGAVASGPADGDERADILRRAPELGTYVCRRCGGCPDRISELFRLEGMVDRQMVDYQPHDPAEYALRLRLGPWFNTGGRAREEFAALAVPDEQLLEEARGIDCPYGINVHRKAAIAIAKLGERSPDYL